MTLLEVPVDPTLGGPDLLSIGGPSVLAPIPVAPDPDETTPIVYATPRRGIRTSLLLCRTGTHEPVGEIRTAEVVSWDDDVDQPGQLDASASTWDPVWSLAGDATTRYRGRSVHEVDLKAYEMILGVDDGDGFRAEAGPFVFRNGPIDVADGRVNLSGPDLRAVFDDRPLGEIVTRDLLEGAGDFGRTPLGEAPYGWVADAGITDVEVVAGGVHGTKALRVKGIGWIKSPEVSVPGHPEVGSSIEGSVFGKFPASVAPGTPVVQTRVKVAGALTASNLDVTARKAGARPDNGTRWSMDPISSGTTTPLTTSTCRAWMELYSGSATEWTYFDLAVIGRGELTGYLEPVDLARYPVRIIRDAQFGPGGTTWGIVTQIMDLCGSEDQITWQHNEQPWVGSALDSVLSRDDGPELQLLPSGVVRVWGQRRGRVRGDVLLGPNVIVSPKWAQDPGAEVDDFIMGTERGTGTSMVASKVSQPSTAYRHRIAAFERAPNGRPLNQVDRLAARRAELAARRQITATVRVPWYYGRKIGTGDTVPMVQADGLLGTWSRPVRVLNRKMVPGAYAVDLTVGVA